MWQFPQGGVEKGSRLEANALREAEEELGVSQTRLQILRRLSATHRYDFSKPPAYAIDKYRGQEQVFFLLEFTGDDSEIDLARHAPEFDAYRWCSPPEVRALAEPKRLPGYEAPLREVEQYLSQRH